MKRDDLIKKSYDFAADLSKQMITLSMAIITLCVAFTDKLFTGASASSNACWLVTSLFIFVVSMSFGIFNLMGLTGQLGSHKPLSSNNTASNDRNAAVGVQTEPESQTNEQDVEMSIYSSTNRCTSIIQVVLFIFGLIFALMYIISSMTSISEKEKGDTEMENKCRCIEKIDSCTYKRHLHIPLHFGQPNEPRFRRHRDICGRNHTER